MKVVGFDGKDIFAYTWLKSVINVGKYFLHGECGSKSSLGVFFSLPVNSMVLNGKDHHDFCRDFLQSTIPREGFSYGRLDLQGPPMTFKEISPNVPRPFFEFVKLSLTKNHHELT